MNVYASQARPGPRAGRPVDTLCALAAEVAPTERRPGRAADLLGGMRELAVRRDLRRMIAPVRPSWKERYRGRPGCRSDAPRWRGAATTGH